MLVFDAVRTKPTLFFDGSSQDRLDLTLVSKWQQKITISQVSLKRPPGTSRLALGAFQSLFRPQMNSFCVPALRFIHRDFPDTFLVYTDGYCSNNGAAEEKAGCAFVFKPASLNENGPTYVRFPLEIEGPNGEEHKSTSHRAELRAVIVASRFRFWTGEGFSTMVIATDSEYVVEGITKWIRRWVRLD